jgi:hypothetical protein
MERDAKIAPDAQQRLSAIVKERQLLVSELLHEVEESLVYQDYRKEIEFLFSVTSSIESYQNSCDSIMLESLVPIQEALLLRCARLHACAVPGLANAHIARIYISPSDGGHPILREGEPLALTAARRFHHNCGGPAILVFVNNNNQNILGSLVIGRSACFGRNAHYHYEAELVEQIVLEDVRSFKPHIVVLMPNNVTNFRADFLHKLRDTSSAFIIGRYGDACSYDQIKVASCLELVKGVDHFIADDGEFVDIAHQEGLKNSEYIPPFVNPHFQVEANGEKSIDILFTGTGYPGLLMYGREKMYERRRRFIQLVDKKFPGKLTVIGKGWNDIGLSRWIDDFISEDEVHRLARKTKIVLAYDGPFTKGFTSGRTFRTLMSEAFLLIRYFPGIENLFINRRHLVWFHSDQQGLALLDYYLDHPEERDRIAQEGHNYLMEHLGWRRKCIIIDYPLLLAQGEPPSFSKLFGQYDAPLVLPDDEEFCRLLETNGLISKYFNYLDILVLAEQKITTHDYSAARVLLTNLLRCEPDFPAALNDLAVLNIIENRLDEADELLAKILADDPHNEVALDNYQVLGKNRIAAVAFSADVT